MASTGVGTKQYYSLINFLDTREILKQIVDVQDDEGLSEIFSTSRSFVTSQETFHHFVNESLFKIGDTTGQSVTGTNSPNIIAVFTAATSGYARKGGIVYFPTGGAVGYITNVSSSSGQDTVTIKSIDGTAITTASGDKYGLSGIAVGEKSINPTNVRLGLTKYFNRIMKFQEVNEITDVENASTKEVEFEGKPYIVYKDLWEKFRILKGTVNAYLWAGKQSATGYGDATPTTPLDPYTSYPTSFTRGLFDYVATYGQSGSVATPGTFAFLTDMHTITSKLLAAKCPKDVFWWSGSQANQIVDDALKALGSSGVTSGRLMLDGKELDFETDKWHYGKFNFNKSTIGILDNQEQFVNTIFPKYALILPMDKTKVEGGDGYLPRLSLRYFKAQVARNQGDDIWEEWHSGALAPTGPIGDERIWRTNWHTTQGLEALGMAQSLRMLITT